MYQCAVCSQWISFSGVPHMHWYPVPVQPQPVYYTWYAWPVVYTTINPKVPYLENRIMYLERRVQELEAKAAK